MALSAHLHMALTPGAFFSRFPEAIEELLNELAPNR
jgi:hypothetical protein